MSKAIIAVGNDCGIGGEVRILAVADIGGGYGVMLGKRINRGVEFVVSTFTFGATEWHNGHYTPDHRNALDRFVNRIDDTLCVFQP